MVQRPPVEAHFFLFLKTAEEAAAVLPEATPEEDWDVMELLLPVACLLLDALLVLPREGTGSTDPPTDDAGEEAAESNWIPGAMEDELGAQWMPESSVVSGDAVSILRGFANEDLSLPRSGLSWTKASLE